MTTAIRTVLGDVAPADLGITYIHEHLIIGGNTYFSFADGGHIATMNRECDEAFRSIG